jgi:hypothetical protein
MSFPRKEGKAKIFSAPKEKCSSCIYSPKYLVECLEYFKDEDLVFGDIVDNGKIIIYDGEKFVDLYENLNFGTNLHMIFQVIKNNVPLDYWEFADHVWFDVSLVYEELLNNYEDHFTYFHYGGNKYFISMQEDATREKLEEYLSKGPVLPFESSRVAAKKYIYEDFGPNTLFMDFGIIDVWSRCVFWYPKYELYKIEKFNKKANFLFENHFSK